ncbi:MAG: glycoside hydrolase family protein [Clostridium sp.]|jgi:hypothetical protein|nr:glycoside hydrolase family protein [Clostridium sp.]
MVKVAAWIIAIIQSILSMIPVYNTLEPYMQDQVTYLVAYAPGAFVKYPFISKKTALVTQSKSKAGGFIKGICHPDDDYENIKGAGIEWNRADIPYPFEADGVTLRQRYIDWKTRMQGFVDNGIKIFAVTPYPYEFLEYGVDPRTDEAKVRQVAEFLVQDLQGIIGGMQITNEMSLPRFGNPLTREERVRFMGIQLEAVAPYKGDIIVGYNNAGPSADYISLMEPYHQYCDYIGLDWYGGCFTNMITDLWYYDIMIMFLWSFTGLPVIITEFGYMSEGQPKTAEEKKAVLEEYGYSSEAEAIADGVNFLNKLPAKFRNELTNVASGNPAELVFGIEYNQHFYRNLSEGVYIPGYPHTPEGQAAVYSKLIEKFAKYQYVIGSFVYEWSDSESCYVCGQSDCPLETRWGIVDNAGNPKPSYYALRDAWAKVK